MNDLSMASPNAPATTYDAVRRFPRMVTDVGIRVFRKTGARTDGRGHDIGAGGMAIYVPLELAIGEEIDLSFSLQYSRVKFGVHAIVRNRDGFRYGVEFIGVSTAELAEIRRVTSIMELAGLAK